MPFVVNSSPGAGLRFEPSATFVEPKAALAWAAGLSRRGMRLIRIRDTVSGQVFDEKSLLEETSRTNRDTAEQAAARRAAMTE